MPSPTYPLDIADDTFVVAAPETAAAVVADPARWATWWPWLDPVVTEDRGAQGLRFALRGAVRGTMEIWLEPWRDGVVVHWYLRAAHDPAARRPDRRRRDVVRAWKRHVHALKDELEAGREPGARRTGAEPPVDAPALGPAVKPERDPAESP